MSMLPEPIRRVADALTPGGRAVLLLGTLGLTAARWSSITELAILGWTCLVLLALAVPWLVVRPHVTGRLRVRPMRATTGDGATIRVTVSHHGGLPVWHPLLRIPTGASTSWTRLRTLRSGGEADQTFDLPTPRRGVLTIGPLEHRVTDPLGLLTSTHVWAPPVELYVRPRMIGLSSLAIGELRDMDGASTDTISMNDLAFHALREYVRGDDMRHVHWRSSARAGELLVRQYQESRRNHLTIVVDIASDSWAQPAEEAFELGVSVAASLVNLAGREGQQVTLVAGQELLVNRSSTEALDALCRIERQPPEGVPGLQLSRDVSRGLAATPDTSTVLLVSGAGLSPEQMAGALWTAPPDLRAVAMRAEPGAEAAVTRAQGRQVLTMGVLPDLPLLMGALR